MSETKACPKCGAELPADAPAGICPKCLMQAGLASEQDGGSGPDMKPTTLTSGFVPPAPEELAKHFPQLEILELLGKGGMGAVYKARQPGLDRLVAVKILPPEVGSDPAFAERFTREARALAKLSHQNIVAVFDFGQTPSRSARVSGPAETDDRRSPTSGETSGREGGSVGDRPQQAEDLPQQPLYYFIMEYVDGANLRHVIETGAIEPEEALAIVPQICEALHFAHDAGIVHRDIKPENILVDKQGRVKIADFGLAKLLSKASAEVTLTGSHQAMGTLHYMAPEQMQGAGSVDHRADIYSLGVVFYEMLTGQLPIGKFEPPSMKVQVDVRLDEVVLRSLESEPDRRYQQVTEMKSDVESISQLDRARSGTADSRVSKMAADSQEVQDVVAERRRVQGPADALIVVACLALLTAVGVGVWLWLVPAASLLQSMTISTLQMMSVAQVVYSIFIIAAAVLMRRLRARMLVLLSVTIVGMAFPVVTVLNVIMELEHIPVWPAIIPMWLGVPIAVWATVVLFRQNVRTAFQAESRQRKRFGNVSDIAESSPRYSRKAIIGFCWAPFFFAALLSFITTTRMSDESRSDSTGLGELSRNGVTVEETVQTVGHSRSSSDRAEFSGPTWWQWALIITILLPGLTAPFGTTILGVVSINDIRHSQGRLTGMPLALADSLLFPLMLLDGLIACLFWLLCIVGYETFGPGAPMNERAVWLCVGITALLSMPTCAYIDFRIVRAAWRIVQKKTG